MVAPILAPAVAFLKNAPSAPSAIPPQGGTARPMPRAFRHPAQRRNRAIIPNRGGRDEARRGGRLAAVLGPDPGIDPGGGVRAAGGRGAVSARVTAAPRVSPAATPSPMSAQLDHRSAIGMGLSPPAGEGRGEGSATAPSAPSPGSATGAIRASRPARKSSRIASSTLRRPRNACCIAPLSPRVPSAATDARNSSSVLFRSVWVGGAAVIVGFLC